MFEFRLFGVPVLLREETPVRILQKPLAMLAFLSLEKGRPHERVFLSDLFWPGHDSTGGPTGGGPTRDPARADHNLRMALTTLRKSLDLPDGASLFSDLRNAVRLNPDFPLETDVSRLLAPPPPAPSSTTRKTAPPAKPALRGGSGDRRTLHGRLLPALPLCANSAVRIGPFPPNVIPPPPSAADLAPQLGDEHRQSFRCLWT